MHNFASTAIGPSDLDRIELDRVWDADEDRRYQNKRAWPTWNGPDWRRPIRPSQTPLLAVRTYAGRGRMSRADGVVFELGPGSLVIMPWRELDSWGTVGDRWRLYWFEFFTDQPDDFMPWEPTEAPLTDAELAETRAILRGLRSAEATARRHATARFAAMLYGWVDHRRSTGERRAHRSRIEKTIDLMHDRLNQTLPVGEMAAAAGLSPRTFAVAFERATGQTPKRYHLGLRLDTARSLLLTGRLNVRQTAEYLGFSSPFYLSKLYKQRFGHPPSDAR